MDSFLELESSGGSDGVEVAGAEEATPAAEGEAPEAGDELGEVAALAEDTGTEAEETPAPEEGAEPKPDAQEQPPAEQVGEQPQPDDELAKEMAADGAKLRTRDGHREWVYGENRGKLVYAGFKKAQAAEEILQEDLTPEAIQTREVAYRDAEWLRLDLISGDPQKQANVFVHLLKLVKNAQEAGEIAGDPTPAAVDAFVSVLARQNPEAYQRLKDSVTPDLAAVTRNSLKDVYQKALETGDKNVAVSAQHIARALFSDYKYLDQKAAPSDPAADREQNLRERENRIEERDRAEMKRGLETWQRTTSTKVQEGVEGAIDAVLGQDPVKKGYEKFPERLNNLRIRFREEVKQAIQSDQAWKQANEQLYRRAQLAASEDVRQRVAADVVKRYAAKAKTVLDRISNKVLSEDAQLLKAGSTATHQRRQEAAQKRGLTGVSGSVRTKVPGSMPNGHVNRADWASALEAL
jgi:hypothetical protein